MRYVSLGMDPAQDKESKMGRDSDSELLQCRSKLCRLVQERPQICGRKGQRPCRLTMQQFRHLCRLLWAHMPVKAPLWARRRCRRLCRQHCCRRLCWLDFGRTGNQPVVMDFGRTGNHL